MNEYTAGDLVEAVKGETVIRGRLKADELGLHLWVGDSGRTPENIESYGFTLSIIEKAAAVVVLPTEPGCYLDNQNDVWVLSRHGNWICPSSRLDNDRALRYAPFTRLEPVSETAKKVLDRVRADCNGDGGYYDHQYTARQLRELFAEFGVTK